MDQGQQQLSGTTQAAPGQPVQQQAGTFAAPLQSSAPIQQFAPQQAPTGPLPNPASAEKNEVQNKNPNSTQNSLQIAEVRDGVVIMQDGSFRSVVLCKSINFDLMSPREREGVELSFQQFLNSLYFNIQIVMRSQKIDLDGYMQKLDDIRANQDNILLGLLMEDYIAYVRYLIEAANIMDKQFYVVVPFYSGVNLEDGLKEGAKKVTGVFASFLKKKKGNVVINEADFTKAKAELQQRVQMVLSGLAQLGVQSIPLNTQELNELYYTVYNPDEAAAQRLLDVDEIQAPVVTKGVGDAPRYGGIDG